MNEWLNRLPNVPPPVSFGWRLITPDIAEQMLRHNVNNRRHRNAVSDRYARDMRGGNWHLNVDPIVFGQDGNLYNGQHTLHAIIKSGTCQKKLIVEDFPLNAIAAMDRGVVRSVFDVLTMQGMEVPRGVAAIAHAWRLLVNNGATGLSLDEVEEIYVTHIEAFNFCMSLPKSKEVTGAIAYHVPFAVAYYHESVVDLERFHAICRDSTTSFEPSESAAAALRSYIMKMKGAGLTYSLGRRDFMLRVLSAIRAFCEGRPLKVSRPVTQLPYCIPGDKQ